MGDIKQFSRVHRREWNHCMSMGPLRMEGGEEGEINTLELGIGGRNCLVEVGAVVVGMNLLMRKRERTQYRENNIL